MKKILTLMIAAAMMIGFTACEKENEKEKPNTLQIGDRTYEIGASCCYWAIEDEWSFYDLWFTNKKLWDNQGSWELPESECANGFEVNVYDLWVIGADPGKIASGTYTYSEDVEANFAHDGSSDYGFYDENGNFGDYIEFGQEYVEASKLEIEIKHINGNIYEIKFTGGVDEEGNSVNGYYKGEVDMFED